MFSRVVAVALLAFPSVQASAGGVYWTDREASQLKRMSFDGSNLQVITLSGTVTSPGTNIRGLAVDGLSDLAVRGGGAVPA